jgi:hypothetical protein
VADFAAALQPDDGIGPNLGAEDGSAFAAWDGLAASLGAALVPSPRGARLRRAAQDAALGSASADKAETNAAASVFAGLAGLWRGADALPSAADDEEATRGPAEAGLAPALTGLQGALQAFLCMRRGGVCSAPDMLWPSVDPSSYAAALQALRDAAAEDPLRGALVAAQVADAAPWLLADATAHLGAKAVAASPQLLRLAMQCCGSDTRAVYNLWKQQVKPLLAQAPSGPGRPALLAAAYHGLLHCLGLAARPDLALQVVYAMKKAGASAGGAPPLSAALGVYRGALQQRQAALAHLPPSERQQRDAQHRTGLLLPLAAVCDAQLSLECSDRSASPAEAPRDDEPARVQQLRANLPVTKIRIRF